MAVSRDCRANQRAVGRYVTRIRTFTALVDISPLFFNEPARSSDVGARGCFRQPHDAPVSRPRAILHPVRRANSALTGANRSALVLCPAFSALHGPHGRPTLQLTLRRVCGKRCPGSRSAGKCCKQLLGCEPFRSEVYEAGSSRTKQSLSRASIHGKCSVSFSSAYFLPRAVKQRPGWLRCVTTSRCRARTVF